eukprot:9263858-Pyramimonas_sp.AAC.2
MAPRCYPNTLPDWKPEDVPETPSAQSQEAMYQTRQHIVALIQQHCPPGHSRDPYPYVGGEPFRWARANHPTSVSFKVCHEPKHA